jgi:DNA-binding beta-propeller fold protein YncE
MLGRWAAFFLDRETAYQIGSSTRRSSRRTVPAERRTVPEAFQPRMEGERLILAGEGTAPGALRDPSALALEPSGNIVIADSGNNRVQLFAPSGRLLAVSPASLRLNGPRALAVGADGVVYVLDTGNARVVKLNRGLRLSQLGPAGGERSLPAR